MFHPHTVDFRLLANAIEQFAHVIFEHDHVNAYVQCLNVLNNYLSMPLALLSNNQRRKKCSCVIKRSLVERR